MIIFKKKEELKKYLKTSFSSKKIGFVPTMGALHKGHLSLIEESIRKCEITICSIFINPTQFNSKNDLIKYPKTLNQDINKLIEYKCDILYQPEVEDLYTKDETRKSFSFRGIDQQLEGEFRPNHFNGVATVVEKLLNIIKPDFSFFGMKDIQQLMVIKELVKNKKINTQIIGLPTVREKNGLAKSSRNIHLTKKDRKQAALIFKQLTFCKQNIKSDNINIILETAKEKLIGEKIKIEYFELINLNSFKSSDKIFADKKYAICVAAYIAGIRLIDNIIL
jgi:pantoate--beta-alanine ligase